MKKPIWDVRIPTLFALLLIAGSIWLTRYFLLQGTQTVGQASKETEPQNIQVTDISATTFTVVFTTSSPAIAGVRITGPNLPPSVFFQNPTQDERTTHRISIPNLSPSTEYDYVILVDGKTYPESENTYSISTAPPFEDDPLAPQYAHGKIILSDGTPASDSLVILESEETHPLSTLTNSAGEYSFNLSFLRSKTLTSNPTLANNSKFTLKSYSADLSSQAFVLYENIFAIPPLTLSQNYDFSQSLQITSSNDDSDTLLSIPTPSTIQSTLSITSPTEGQSTIDERLTIRGTSVPNALVNLDLQPSDIIAETSADSTGRWQYRPDTNLPQGVNTLTVHAKDSFGVTRSITRTFSIFPAGSQVSESATPSGTLTPTTTPPQNTPTPTTPTTPTITVTIPPSPTVTPTNIPTVTNTPPPTVPPVITITPTPPGSVSTLLITFSSVILIIAGTTLLFVLG